MASKWVLPHRDIDFGNHLVLADSAVNVDHTWQDFPYRYGTYARAPARAPPRATVRLPCDATPAGLVPTTGPPPVRTSASPSVLLRHLSVRLVSILDEVVVVSVVEVAITRAVSVLVLVLTPAW